MDDATRDGTNDPKPAPAPGGLHQISMSFSPEEDRVLLRISTTDHNECRLWLTRRFVRILWKALLQVLNAQPDIARGVGSAGPMGRPDLEPKVKEAILAMQHHDVVQASDFSQKYDVKKENKPVSEKPMLVIGGACYASKDNHTRIKFQTADGKEINVKLNAELVHALCHLLVATAVKAEWNLELVIGGANVFVPEKPTHLH